MIITRTPVRVSFFGGGSDFPEYFGQHRGAALSTAIDRYCYLTAARFPSRLFDYSIRLSYRKVELAKQRDDIEHRLFKAGLELCDIDSDIELNSAADLPAFSGLGSSSSFTVGLLHALHAFKGERRTAMDLAYEAIHIERAVLGDAVGCQDQVIAAVGGFNRLEFRAEDDITVEPLGLGAARLEELEAHSLLVFTAMTRSAGPIEQSKLDQLETNRKHLESMVSMVDEASECLISPRTLERFGRLLERSWVAKKQLSGQVSNPFIDELYDRGRKAGAWGGKLLGAGAGGFLLLLAPPEAMPALTATFADREVIRPRFGAQGSRVIFNE